MDAADRVRGVSQRVLCVTPGPNAPADLESFLHPIAAQLDELAAGIGGVTVAGADRTHVLRAYVLQFTTDMPGGDKMLNAKGHNARRPNRCRPFEGVHDGKVYLYPPVDPFTKKRLFSIHSAALMRRTAASVWADAVRVEAARQEGKSQAAVNAIAVNSGIKGYSLFFCPSPADRQRYPHLSYLWKLGPATLPYDPMHLFFSNITPMLWRLVSGKYGVLGQSAEPYIMSKKTVETIGQEIADGRPTVPLAQARSLRDISVHSSSYKAVDWMFFLLSAGEAVLADRIPDEFFDTFMDLSRASRLLFRPRGITAPELTQVDKYLKRFCARYYKHFYAGLPERLELCRSTVAALLDVIDSVRTCGPAWSFWQFPVERLISTLTPLIKSRRHPYESLVNALTHKYRAQAVVSWAKTFAAADWEEATGKPITDKHRDPPGSYSFSEGEDPSILLLPPKAKPAGLTGPELQRMNAVLALEGLNEIPATIIAKKYFRMRLARGQVCGTFRTNSASDSRRDYLVSVRSTVERRARGGGGEEVEATVYGAVHHFAVVYVAGAPRVFAYIECVKSSVDRRGAYGLPERRRNTDCFSSLGGVKRYVSALAIDAVVGTLFVRSRHVVLYCRDRFSHE